MDLTIHPEQILIMFVVFMACVTVLNLLVFRPTLVLLQEREKHLSGLSAEAKNIEEQCHQKLETYNARMDEARTIARTAREDLLKVAEVEQKQILLNARTDTESTINAAKKTISVETAESRLKLRQHAQELSKTMVDKILRKKVA